MLRYLSIPTITFTDADGVSRPVKDLLEPSLAQAAVPAPTPAVSNPNQGRIVLRALQLRKSDGTPVKKSDSTLVLVAKQVIGGR